MYKNIELEKIIKDKNLNVLLMLSGGKDSTASLCFLKAMNIKVTAIHFRHRWSYKLSSFEAKRICNIFKIKLIEIDFTEEFHNAIKGYMRGRPCLLCKKEMYKILLTHFITDEYDTLCIGDNANDKTTINRLLNHIKHTKERSIYYNSYLGSELGVKLPQGVKVIRPMLGLSSIEIENYLTSKKIVIQKNHSTGDKYFEYSREGCPIQFHDPGYPINIDSMNELVAYNLCITSYAKSKNIKASIHLPSCFIVTIPVGYEIEAAQYLLNHNFEIDLKDNNFSHYQKSEIEIAIKSLLYGISNDNILPEMYIRFLERLNIQKLKQSIKGNKIIWKNTKRQFTFELIQEKEICIKYSGLNDLDFNLIRCLIIEIFRTRNYSIFLKN